MNFDETYWRRVIAEPNWYLQFLKYAEKVESAFSANSEELGKRHYEYREFFERALAKGEVALASSGPNLDIQRLPIDTVVIHHTSNKPGLTKGRLSAIELFRLYSSVYANSNPREDPEVYNQPIYSGHFRNGLPVFWAYHWLIRTDGSQERLLLDREIGWHAGNWDINCRSVGIVFDNDLENSKPNNMELKSLASLIKSKYCMVSKDRILGHNEVNLSTICPSNMFLTTKNFIGWKEDLLTLI